MKKFYLFTVLLLVSFVFTACGSNNPGLSPFAKKEKVYGFSFINGEVLEMFGDKVIVQIEDKDIVVGSSYEVKLTNNIIKSSLFIKGMSTHIGRSDALVTDIRGDQITFKINKGDFKSGQKVKIFIPKKTIAVMDFSIIGSNNNNIEKYAMEDMTTKMVQSGQYIVVERSKLDTILKEQELADSGLLNEKSASKIGELVSADIILTGSFAKKDKNWDVNLRLVDVSTGIIISAIKERISGKEFQPKQSKDNTNLTENFEDENFSKGWLKNLINKKGAKSKSTIDTTQGANETSSSLKINYFLKKRESAVVFVNKRARDLSNYTGIKFYAKAQKKTTLAVILHDKNYDDANMNRWKSIVSVGNNWQEFKIPFDELQLAKNYARKLPGGDGSLDLDSIDNIALAIGGKANQTGKKISFWIDEITLY